MKADMIIKNAKSTRQIEIIRWRTNRASCCTSCSGLRGRPCATLAGRLASIKIVFSESYEMPNYTQSEVDELYSEIKKSVGETIREKE